MANITTATPGHFCWIELATSDALAAKEFYRALFGWATKENDMGEMGIYYLFQINDRNVAAMYGLMPDQKAQGIPPNWLNYVSTANADDSVAKAAPLGAVILAPPFDVYDLGRMAVLKDPQGAVFALWQAKESVGMEVRNEENTLCWNELATSDADAARTFYTSLLDWTAKGSAEYTEWHIGATPIGGMRVLNAGEPTPPNWMPYFLVDDVDEANARVQSGGGKTYAPPTDMPNVGRFAVVSDPQGAVFALFKPA